MTGARYRQIADELRERIALGDVGSGGALESEAALGGRYLASRMTIRKALDLLRDEGLLESRQGAGWFVAGRSFHQALAIGSFRHAESAVTSAGQQLHRRVVSFAFEPAPDHVAAILGLRPGADTLHCRSVRSADGDPLERSTEWVRPDLAADISRADAAAPGIWQSLHRSGTTIDAVRQSITAGIAGALDQSLLGAPVGSPLLLIRRVPLATDGDPIALSDHRYLAHRFSLEVEFRGWSPLADEPPGLREEPG
ncbi:GntR family transcriptional regulator [Nakamurella lactea]|uniref:GntR family transcriptional regulator n=1 Tax=Nakamurella lactea TaxID=459515 RepID=UPI0003F9DA6E|nr:GntR family transcriptional regulator [Nakamurella lactea]